MSTYKEIKGTTVQDLDSDPTNQLGDIFYNSTSNTLKAFNLGSASWTSSGNLGTARAGGAGSKGDDSSGSPDPATAGGGGGIGIQLPSTFQDPRSAPTPNGGGLGMPGPTATNVAGGTPGKFWVAGGGGGQAFQPTTGAKGGGAG